MNLYQPTISGSLVVSGSVSVIGPFTMSGGSISGTASFAQNAGLLSSLDSSSFVGTGSYNTLSSSFTTVSSSYSAASGSFSTRVSTLETASGSFSGRITKIEGNYATTGSNIFLGAQTVCANITSTGTIIAQTLNVQQVTSSVVYSSGSNTFGNQLTDVQQMTGSLRITGSMSVLGNACATSIVSFTTAGTNTSIHARGGGDAGGQGKGNFRSSDSGGTNFWDFGRDNLSTGAFVISPSGSSSSLSIFNSGVSCFSCTVCSPVQVVTSCMSIGSSAVPNDLLTVYGSTNNGINVCASDQPRLGFFVGGTSADNKIWDFIPQSNNTFIARVVNDAQNASAVWMNVTRNTTTITSICFPQTNPMVISGCVGIGVAPSGPGLRLASCTVLRVEGACSGDTTPDNFGISIGGLGSFRVDCGGVSSGRFIINSCGCVGINQPSPIFKLQVSSGGAKTSGTQDPSLFIGTNEVSNPWGLRVKPVGAASIGNRYVEFQTTEVNVADGGSIVFQNGGGQVGIGCASPGYVLDVRDGTTGSAGGRGMRLSVCSNSAGPQFRLEYQCSGNSRNWLIGTNQEVSGDFIIRSSTVAGCDPGGACSATRLSINKDGCVGIGTVSPNGLLHIQQCRGGEVGFRITNSQGASADTSATVAINMTLQNGSGGSSGVIQLIAGKESDHQTAANVDDYFAITTTSNDATTERFRITADGRSYFTCQLRVGTSAVASKFHLDVNVGSACVVSGTPGTACGCNMSGIRVYNDASGTSNSLGGVWFSTGPHWAGIASGRCDHTSGWGTDIRFYTHEDATNNLDQSTERVRINSGGTVTFFAYGTGTLSTNSAGVISASDGRLKTKTRAIESGLCSIMKLCPTYYRWNECTPFHTEYEELGFIAQEVSCAIPEASPEPEEENKLKNYSDRAIIAMLTKGMQEQQCTIDLLKTCLGIA